MKKKKPVILLSSILLFLILCSSDAGAAGIQVAVDGTPVKFVSGAPYVDGNGRTMIPLRAVADALGCETVWDSDRQSATVQKAVTIGTQSVTLSQTFYPNDIDFCSQWAASATVEQKHLDFGLNDMSTRALVKNGTTYLPIRYVAEYFGYTVQWDGAAQTVRIQSEGRPGTGADYFALKEPITGKLTSQRLCSSVWGSNGYRFSDTNIYTFSPDGTLTMEWASGALPLKGTYLLQGDTVIASILDIDLIEYFDYDHEKNILVCRNGRKIVEQESGDGRGSHFEGKTTVEILEPYRANPYTSHQSINTLRQSIVPPEFSENNIKKTVRPYLQALSFLAENNTSPFLDLDYSSSWYDNNDWEHNLIKNFTSVQQVKDSVKSFFTEEYFQKYFPDHAFQMDNGKLYYVSGARGSGMWDANSAAYAGLIGKNEVAVEVDSYGSGENYCGTYTIYFRKTESGYCVSGTSWEHRNKNIPSHDYTPVGWDPV